MHMTLKKTINTLPFRMGILRYDQIPVEFIEEPLCIPLLRDFPFCEN